MDLTPTQPSPSGTQALDRAARLLAHVVQSDSAPTFSDLCADAGYARSTTWRLLTALERNHLLRRGDDGGYEPGPLFDQFAARTSTNDRLVGAARPLMERLSVLTGETINLGVAMGGVVVQVEQVDSTYFLGSRDWVGVDLPAHTSALGKVLYAHGLIPPPDGPLETLTERTVTTGAQLRRQLPSIRRNGYASTVDELEVGLTGIAAPVFADGRPVAALGLSGPSTRLADRIPDVGAIVSEQAAILTSRLGARRKEGAA